MKVITEQNRIILVGKAWEIKAKLKEYNQSFVTVKEWIESTR
ncbi:Z-ring formation inhibitor MciZ [Bacillus sp. BHET2]|nr:Z-ring formation inhibitor MciZ [Bacillus sp. BHET2]TMU86681.1 Z-ring formation inhibitor MciZ [Bacillus sp. BHET2]